MKSTRLKFKTNQLLKNSTVDVIFFAYSLTHTFGLMKTFCLYATLPFVCIALMVQTSVPWQCASRTSFDRKFHRSNEHHDSGDLASSRQLHIVLDRNENEGLAPPWEKWRVIARVEMRRSWREVGRRCCRCMPPELSRTRRSLIAHTWDEYRAYTDALWGANEELGTRNGGRRKWTCTGGLMVSRTERASAYVTHFSLRGPWAYSITIDYRCEDRKNVGELRCYIGAIR